jgi:hypothetical protein
MNWLYYLAEANIYLGVFYLAYRLLLTKETYYQLTRAYLLFGCVVSFILPILQIGALKPVEAAVTTTLNYSVPEYTGPLPVAAYVNTTPVVVEHHLTVQDYLIYLYIVGASVLFFLLMVKLFSLLKLVRNAQTVTKLHYKVVYLRDTDIAFSFFNYLFIGDNAPGADTIIRHELVHIRQKHSFDIIFLEVLKVVNWFNPFVYLLQKSLKTVHEYIADEQTAASETDALAYATFLVNNAYGAGGPSFTHSFFNYNLLKKRIIMLNRQRSGRIARLKYLVTVPICAALLCSSTLAFSKTYGWVDIDPARPIKKDAGKIQSSQQKPEALKFAPPSVMSDNLVNLNKYLYHTVRYDNTVSKLPGGIVEVNFTITADHKITDAKITKSAGAFDAIVLRALKGYNGTVDAKAGQRRFIFDFYHGNHTPEEEAFINNNPDTRAGYMVILRPAPKPKSKLIVVDGKIVYPKPGETVSADSMVDVPENTPWAIKKWGDKAKNGVRLFTGHGQVIKKSESPFSLRNKFGGRMVGSSHNAQVPITQMLKKDPGLLFIVDGKKVDIDASQLNDKTLISMTGDSMTVYDKGNAYAKSKWGKNVGQVVVLQGHASAKLFNWPKADSQAPADGPDPATLLTTDFVNYLQNNIKFPSFPLNDNFVLTFDASFVIANNRVTGIELVKNDNNNLAYTKKPKEINLSDEALQSFQNEILKILPNAPADHIQPGKYTLPIAFLFKKDNELFQVMVNRTMKTATGSLFIMSIPVIKAGIKPALNGYNPTPTDWNNFGQDLARNVKYTTVDRDNHIQGKVIAIFSVDDDHHIQYIKVVRTPSDWMSGEVIRSLKINKYLSVLKPGVRYTVPVEFTLGVNDSSTGEMVEPGVQPTGYKSDPAKNIYNPSNMFIDINQRGGLMLNQVIIRGYIKRS